MKHLVIVSDLHINSTVGLCNVTVPLDDGGYYEPSRSQKWLYDKWVEFWNEVSGLQNSGDIITVINGDMVDVNKHSRHQLITQNISTVVWNAQNLLYYVNELSSKVFVIRGTAAHVGSCAEIENILSERIQAVPNGANSYSWWQLNLDVEGVLIDIAHHGRLGNNSWNRSNPLNTLAASITFEAIKRNVRIPELVIRSHNHTHADTHDNLPVRVIATPAWQLSTEYSHRLGIVEMADIGGIIISCDGGKYEVKKYLYRPEHSSPVVA